MHRFAIVAAATILAAFAGLAVAQDDPRAPSVPEQIAAFGGAATPAERAAIAAALAKADLSSLPFAQLEQLQLRSALAEALNAGGNGALAIETLRAAIQEGRRALAASADPAETSALQTQLAAQLEALGDLQISAADIQAATASYEEAYRLQSELLGQDEPQTRFVLEKLVNARKAASSPVTGAVRGGALGGVVGNRTRSVTRAATPASAEEQRLATLKGAAAATELSALGQGDAQQPFETVRVFFGSSRNVATVDDPERAFGGARGPLTFGSVVVTVPKLRAVGSIPRPTMLDLAGAKDGLHVVLKRVERDATAGDFTNRLQRSVAAASSGRREAFVYVHGYNETFANGARRAAQLAIDLDMRGGAVMYTWPSGDLLTYQVAQNNVEPSVAGLVSLLRTVSNSGAARIHIFAHSMGNRVLLQALDRMHRDGFSPGKPAFDQVIFASPDVDADTFVRQVTDVKPLARGMTLYASKNDRALAASSWLSGGYARAGQTPLSPAVMRSVVSVDTSLMSRPDWIGHSDFAVGAINDVRAVVWLSLSPQARCPLQLRGGYWEAASTRAGCDDVAFRRAISALRLYGKDAVKGVETRVLETSGQDQAGWRAALAIVQRLQN